ncbi:MAG: hypothetical protein JRJ02_11370 [Deltaproteobacteria bacterium]|nr:hypothetical protein [Deltaproteobacteria bacterium]
MRKILIGLSILGSFAMGNAMQIPLEATVQTRESLRNVVLSNATENKVVMFGGVHGSYREDENFVAELIPRFGEAGFAYLALEFEKNPRKNSLHEAIKDYAFGRLTRETIRTAWIKREQRICAGTFDLIDAAKKAKMKIVFYDADDGTYKYWRDRERIAFDNLEQMIFDKDPIARVVIFCGLWHINERPHEDASAELGGWLPERIKYLAFYFDEAYKSKTFTVSLLGPLQSKIITPYCDMVLDLEENTYYYQKRPS